MQSSHLGRGWGEGQTECIIGEEEANQSRDKPVFLALKDGQINCFHRQAAFHINLVLSKLRT